MMAGVTKQRRGAGRKGRTSSVSREAAATFAQGHGCAHPNGGRLLEDGEGLEGRKVFDVWYTPTIKDVYAQFKVAEQMLSRVNDPSLAYVKRKVYEVEDLIWQFIQG